MIYLPEGVDGVCYIPNNGYITVYKTNNYNSDSNIIYDVYLDTYIVRQRTGRGTTQQCDTSNIYTHDVTYRTDFDSIIICLFILYFVIYLMFKMLLFPFLPFISRRH